MPIPLFNSVASWFLKKRIHQIELFMKYPNEVQHELLYSLISSASKTEVGLISDFSSIKNYEDFKNRLPIVNYEDICKQIERCRMGEQNIFWPTTIKWFAKSSGTTMLKVNSSPSALNHLKIVTIKQEKICFQFIIITMRMLKF